ncbi:hypothetical protein [Streptomyces sp. ID05-04B]|uniref:hypothetical protein n=1 Tax=Streptomyces sp. ID05-04B TaxID=3028661 RepID=UPI0029C9D942|nr:hypothetical protein [Streptomyces sp. ID05-04B]
MVSEAEPLPVLKLVAETVAVQLLLPLLVTLTDPSATLNVAPARTVPILVGDGTVITGGANTAWGTAKTAETVMVLAAVCGGSTRKLAHSAPPVPIRKERRGHERDRDPTHAPSDSPLNGHFHTE